METNKMNEWIKTVLILLMSLSLILLAQFVKFLKNPEKALPITGQTFLGLFILGLITIIGILIQKLVQKLPVKALRDFPILGWVSMASLVFCSIFPFAIKAMGVLLLIRFAPSSPISNKSLSKRYLSTLSITPEAP